MRMPKIVGVLNVTPDSFFDGGKYDALEAAARRAGQLLAEGADIVEVGGESTGPRSKDVSEADEIARTIPVIEAIRAAHPGAAISIDTYKAAVAAKAIAAGATMVNDVTAGRGDARLFPTVGEAGAALAIMYAKDPTPRTTVDARRYDDVVATIKEFLRERRKAAVAAGVALDKIVLDPGLGHFVSSDPGPSFEIIARLPEFRELGSPVFLSPSRKSFVAGSENLPTAERLPGTIAASAIAAFAGADYIRTHDVKEVRRACEIAAGIRSALR